MLSLLSAEPDLLIASFVLSSIIYYTFKGNLFALSLGIQKDRIGRGNIIAHELFRKAKLSSVAA